MAAPDAVSDAFSEASMQADASAADASAAAPDAVRYYGRGPIQLS
jgi:hypothetical protein